MFKWMISMCLVTLPFSPVLPSAGDTIPFEVATLHLEYNATDADAEIVFTIEADERLKDLRVFAPDGQVVLSIHSKNTHQLGLAKMAIESPEPSLRDVQIAYPEGTYRFLARTVAGDTMFGTCNLSHDLPDAPVITFPLESTTRVPVHGSTGTWNPVANAVGYALEIEDEETENSVKALLLESMTSFTYPDTWMLRDREYAFGVAAIGANGNVTVSEIHFTTER